MTANQEKTIYFVQEAALPVDIRLIDKPAGGFPLVQKAIEQLILLGQTKMTKESEIGDWGQWCCNAAMWEGCLYTPFGKNGLAATSLLLGEDGDIGRARLAEACAVWWDIPTGMKEYMYAVVAVPGGEWHDKGEVARKNRVYFLYQETTNGNLRLERFGSESRGWFNSPVGGFAEHLRAVDFFGNRVPTNINGPELLQSLQEHQEQKRVELSGSLLGET